MRPTLKAILRPVWRALPERVRDTMKVFRQHKGKKAPRAKAGAAKPNRREGRRSGARAEIFPPGIRAQVSSPVVSIIVPFYQDAAYLENALRSIAAQTFEDFECLTISDKSLDGSLAIAETFAKTDQRFRVIAHKVNSGLSAARNTGLARARGMFVQFLDGDDMLTIDAIESRVRVALRHLDDASVAGVYGGSKAVGPEFDGLERGRASPHDKTIDFYTTRGACPFVVSAPLLRTGLLRRAGGFNEQWTTAEDHELWYRLMRNGYRFLPSGSQANFYRMKPGTSMASRTAMQHLANSASLQSEARHEMPVELTMRDAPFPFVRPWGYYDEAVQIARRVFSFGAMAGDVPSAVRGFLPNDTWPVVERHVPALHEIEKGRSRLAGRPTVAGATDVHFVPIAALVDTGGQSTVPPPQKHGKPQSEVGVIFLPHKDYHVRTAAALRPHLESRGLSVAVVDFERHYRDEGVARMAKILGMPTYPSSSLDFQLIKAAVVVCFNDWDKVVQGFLATFQEVGTPTVGIVEGVQDYHDIDTGRPRRPYQTVDFVLAPGEFDQRYFDNNAEIGGLANVEQLWLADYSKPTPARAVANVNFSYNVLTEARDQWVEDVSEACRTAEVDLVFSQHPADLGDLSKFRVSGQSIYQDLLECNVLISRFSTVILEALAMGRRVIYFNPHGEEVDKFADGACVPVARSVEELTVLLSSMRLDTSDRRESVAAYLAFHCGVDPHRLYPVVVERIANSISTIVTRSKTTLAFSPSPTGASVS